MQIKNSEFISKSLNCDLPSDYSEFVDNNGYGDIDNIEIYGYSPQTKDINKIPCIIGATNIYRNKNIINDNEILLANDDGTLYGYNCNAREYFKKNGDSYIKIKSPFENGFY